MGLNKDEIAELQQLCDEAREYEEGGVVYVLLRGLRLPDGCVPTQTDALLCSEPMHGYGARLFFPEQVQSRQTLNWNMETRILERGWHAYSWQLNATGLRLAQKVANIMGGLR